MSKVWTRKGKHSALQEIAKDLVLKAQRRKRISHLDLPWLLNCSESAAFVEYWFAEPQRSSLASLALQIARLRERDGGWVCDALQLALSRIIVTKQAGASLAWDVSHSRPHRKRDENDYDVFEGFLRATQRLVDTLDSERLPASGNIGQGDCRRLTKVKRASVDAVVTSPPYLNAIDYLRGHKLSLVWLGHTIPDLRAIRGGAVGTERAGSHNDDEYGELENAVRSIRQLPPRQKNIVRKYAQDAALIIKEMKRVLRPGGLLVLVLGDSNLQGNPVYNSRIFKHIASANGFILETERKRPLQSNRRYLPIAESSGALANRMKTEVLQSYRCSSSA
ncbi:MULTISPECIES: hypothetical protein [unclassified Bradyrhizobium]|uniref:hypothetical protein n=1 Tax=unclassified Bradyrhizobium TaxID=2631580 RepID=UPI002915C946|nr:MULTISPECIES: hypothetical protein [unclassified Bradyrhizobium]